VKLTARKKSTGQVAGEIETGRFASLRQEEIAVVAFDPTARLQAEGMTYRFVRDGSFKAERRD
jgi:hypothetical protein